MVSSAAHVGTMHIFWINVFSFILRFGNISLPLASSVTAEAWSCITMFFFLSQVYFFFTFPLGNTRYVQIRLFSIYFYPNFIAWYCFYLSSLSLSILSIYLFSNLSLLSFQRFLYFSFSLSLSLSLSISISIYLSLSLSHTHTQSLKLIYDLGHRLLATRLWTKDLEARFF